MSSSLGSDQPKPPDVIGDLVAVSTWPSSGLDAKVYEKLVVVTYVSVPTPKGSGWASKVKYSMEPSTKVIIPEDRRNERGFVLAKADAVIVKRFADNMPAFPQLIQLVTNTEFLADFAEFFAPYSAAATVKQRRELATTVAGVATWRKNAAEERAAEAKMTKNQATAAAWTQGRERANAVAALAALRAHAAEVHAAAAEKEAAAAREVKAIAAAEAKAATAACDAKALANGLVGLGLKTPARLNSKSIALALERVRTPKAVGSLADEVSSPLYFQSSAFKVKKPLEADFPFLAATSAGDNECLTVPAAADFVNGVPPAHLRSLSTFGLGISCVATPANENGAGLWYNPDGELASPFLIGMTMSASIDRWIVPNGLDRWANTPFYKRRDALRREEQCPARIQTSL